MGRPREFDRDKTIERAMRLFWKKGYEGVSLQNLLDELEINNSSFYHAFQSKEALFDEVLDYYFHKVGAYRIAPLLEGKPVRETLENYFERLIDVNFTSKLPGGCLIANSVVLASSSNPTIATKVSKAVQATTTRMETAFFNLLKRGRETGEVTKEFDLQAHARFMVTVIFGLNLLTRASKSREELKELTQMAIQMCCGGGKIATR
jgi:TetR/AcrR family transcriptional regulator, transcriptional repressor for nem operon